MTEKRNTVQVLLRLPLDVSAHMRYRAAVLKMRINEYIAYLIEAEENRDDGGP